MFASCDKNPTSPRPPQQPGPSSPVTTVRLELVAPAKIAPGESVQLAANAIKSDGSVENVSSKTNWSATNFSQVLQLSDRPTGAGVSFYGLLHGLVQHDTYHAGQIALLKKRS